MSRPQDMRLPYLPGIDALRALAVLAVFLYHAGIGWLPGGFLGVDLFFTISGYLITSLLLAELHGSGRIALGRFWLRRARRLLPAVGVFVAATIVIAAIVEPDRIAQLRGDALAALFYVANWHFVLSEVSYFEQFQRPSLFTHLWSLSVEEQFYLFWPVLFAGAIKLVGRRLLLLGVLLGALASVVLAWVLFHPGGDASRLYYGTDTHAVGLLAGVALALVWSPAELRRLPRSPLAGPLLDALGAVALAYILFCFAGLHDYDLALWHGGYLWLVIAAAALLAALAHPDARLGSLLGRAPVLWLGLRSYSFYLWHWPVLALTRPGIDVDLPRGLLIPLQLLAVLALADLSYRFVELPFRGRAGWPRLPDRWLALARPALMLAALAVVLLVGWSGLFAASSRPPASAASTAQAATVRAAAPGPETEAGSAARPGPEARITPRRGRPPRIIALGDSVMIGARDELAKRLGPGFSMSAEVGRQADEFVRIARRLRRQGHRPDALIIQMGNNGPLYGDEMAALQRATSKVGELFLVNDHAPVSWVGESNHALAEAARDWPHTTLIEWRRVAAEHENLLWDGIHLTPAGAKLYARVLTEAVRKRVAGLPAWRHRQRSSSVAAPAAKRGRSNPRMTRRPAQQGQRQRAGGDGREAADESRATAKRGSGPG